MRCCCTKVTHSTIVVIGFLLLAVPILDFEGFLDYALTFKSSLTFYLNFGFTCILLIYLIIYKLDICIFHLIFCLVFFLL